MLRDVQRTFPTSYKIKGFLPRQIYRLYILYVVTIARHNSGVRKKETNPRPGNIPVTFGVNTVATQKPPKIGIEADFGGEILIEIIFIKSEEVSHVDTCE